MNLCLNLIKQPGTKKFCRIFFLIIFLFAAFIPQFYIWSDLFVQEFDADVAESVIWAQASLESGSLINPDYGYTHLLPFGGQFIFVPIVARFGVGIYSLRLGLSIWAGIFSLLILGFFAGLGWDFERAALASSIVIIFLSATELLREIFWSHVVHYNLSIFYLFLSIIFLSFFFTGTPRRKIIGLTGLMICLLLGSANDIAVMLFFSIALLFGIIMERFLSGGIKNFFTKENLLLAALTAAGICAGYFLGKMICRNASTAYTDQFTIFAPADQWMDNLLRIPNNWLQMFSSLPESDVPFFSSVGIKLMIRIAVALVIVLLSMRSMFIWSALPSRQERIFICVHWFISAAILFVYIFGIIYLNPWRITPMLFTGLITALIILKHDFTALAEKKSIVQLLCIGSAAAVVLYSGIGAFTVFRQPVNDEFWTGKKSILKILTDEKLTYGYSLDHWFANSITVLTDEQIRSREVLIQDGKVSPCFLQSNKNWFSDQPGVDKYFLISQENDFWQYPEIAEGAIATFRADQERTFRDGKAGFFIFVFDKNLF